MAKVKFHKDFLINELDLPWGDAAIKDSITGTSRWSIHHELVFSHDGKFYLTHYSAGATESQDESPWDYETEVECIEVELKEKTIMVWQPIA